MITITDLDDLNRGYTHPILRTSLPGPKTKVGCVVVCTLYTIGYCYAFGNHVDVDCDYLFVSWFVGACETA